MYLWKSKIIEALLRLWMVRLIFLTKVESLTEQDEIEVEDSIEDIIEYFSPYLYNNKYMNSHTYCGHRDLNSRSN
jgi:hypothetical protein